MFQVDKYISKFKTRYNKSWEDISIYPDFAKRIFTVPGDQLLTRCKYCKSNPINLTNIGMQALKSPFKGAKHLKLIATICNLKTIASSMTDSQDITSKPGL